MTPSLLASLRIFLRARFSRNSHLGLRFTIGVLAVLAASWFFGHIAEDVATREPITELDVQVSQWFHSHATKPVTQAMLIITDIHGTPGILLLSLFLALWTIRKKEWYWLLTLLLAVPGGMLLNVALKHIFQRVRPSFDEPLLSLSTYSFPSGHAASATVFYGLLAAYLFCKVKSWPWRIAIAVAAVTLVGLVGLTRIYLGVHYPSDVLAGITASIAWLAFIFTVIAPFRQCQATRRSSE